MGQQGGMMGGTCVAGNPPRHLRIEGLLIAILERGAAVLPLPGNQCQSLQSLPPPAPGCRLGRAAGASR